MEFNDVRLQYEALRNEIDSAARKVFEDGQYILGPRVQSFEEEFARYCGAAHGVGVASGTDALVIALKTLGIGPGDGVLVPAISAPATAMAVVLAGARPVFADISPATFTMAPQSAAERKTAQCRAVIPVHLYGMPAPVQDISNATGLPVIEDAAQAHGSDGAGGRCGSLGVLSAFSFYPTKNLGTYGDGGMVVTMDGVLADAARLLRNYGQRRNYDAERLGFNSRLDELHASILGVKLRMLDRWNERRRTVASTYRGAFEDLPVRLQQETGRSNYHLFVLSTERRDELRAFLKSEDIPSLVHYPAPLHRQGAFQQFDPDPCPEADRLASTVLSLPMHAHLSGGDIDRVIHCVRVFFGR